MQHFCGYCSREFEGRKELRYCSKRCGYRARWYRHHAPRTCSVCLSEFWVKQSDMGRQYRLGIQAGLYCSMKCQQEAWVSRPQHITAKVVLEEIPKPLDTDLAWAAGIIDGEGCIAIGKLGGGYLALRLQVTNTDPRMLEKCLRLFGGKITPRKQVAPARRPIANWYCYGRTAARVLEWVRPYLVAKQDQCDVALEFATTIGSKATLSGDVLTLRRRLLEKLTAMKHAVHEAAV